VRAIARMVKSSSGTALQRFKLAVSAYDLIRAEVLLAPVKTATEELDAVGVDQSEVSECRAVIEQMVLTLLPFDEVEEARRVVSDVAARMLVEYGSFFLMEDIEAVGDALLNYGKDRDRAAAAVTEALRAQVDEIDALLDEIHTLEDLDGFEQSFESAMRKYQFSDRRFKRDVEYRRETILERGQRERTNNYGSSIAPLPGQASNEEIRSMFHALLR
jgi:hypothetical protein